VFCDLADFNLLLEYWSTGVLENRRPNKHLLGMEMDVDGILFAWISRDLDHYSNTPVLQHSLYLFKAEPTFFDPVHRAEFSLLE